MNVVLYLQEAQLAASQHTLPPLPEVSRDESASGLGQGEAVLQSNSDFLDRLLGDPATADTPTALETMSQTGADEGFGVDEKIISDAAADEVIQEVLDQEHLEVSDIEDSEVIPLSDLSDDSEAANEVLQKIFDTLDRTLLPDEAASRAQTLQGSNGAQNEPVLPTAKSEESADSASIESEEAEEAMKEILEASDLNVEAESRLDQDLQEQVGFSTAISEYKC